MPEPAHADARRRVVLTGGAGRIAQAVAPVLARRWDLVLTDTRAADGVGLLHVTDGDACRAAFAGADAVVHLAANPAPDATFEALLSPNLVGAYAVVQAAVDAGVRRLVLASSLHATSALPTTLQRRTTDQPRPGNLYGATKAWAEALGAWAAATTNLSVVALRIGYFSDRTPGPDAALVDRTAWLSVRDAAELVRAAVEADLPVGPEGGAGFVVAHGVSANRYGVAELESTRGALGYAPVDDAWAAAASGSA